MSAHVLLQSSACGGLRVMKEKDSLGTLDIQHVLASFSNVTCSAIFASTDQLCELTVQFTRSVMSKWVMSTGH